MKEKITGLFLYAGIEPEQYRIIEGNLQEENRNILLMMTPVSVLIFACLVVAAFFNETMMTRIWLYIMCSVLGIGIYIFARKLAKGRVALTNMLVHLFNLILFGFGFLMDIYSRPNGAAVSFVLIVVITQLVFNVRPMQSGMVSLLAVIIFILVAFQIKSDEAILDDILNLISFWGAGLALNLMLSNARARSHLGMIEQKRQREEIQLALKAADQANDAKTAFLFNMSHDIRTPMNAIIGYTDLLEKNEDLTKTCQKEYIEKIKISSKYLLELLDNVLEMSRIESGKLQLDEEPCDIRQFMDTQIIIIEESIQKKHLDFHYSCRVDHPYVYIDNLKVREVMLNILSNSVKYTPDNGSISILLEEVPCDLEGYVKYHSEFTDTGIGISKEFLPHLFEAFSRERNTTESQVAGTGLGMGIVKKLVDLMGGSIKVESEVGNGTTTILEFTHRIAQQEDIAHEPDPQVLYDGKKILSGKRVLLAEDNSLNAEIATQLLSDAHLLVEHACDGVECVDMLTKSEDGYYDVILMDIQMPNMDGYKATRTIRSMADTKKGNIPIIAMTANAFAEDRKNAQDAGMNGHVSKPIHMEKLLAEIVSALHS